MKRYQVEYETGRGYLEVMFVKAASSQEAKDIVRDEFDGMVDIVDVVELDK